MFSFSKKPKGSDVSEANKVSVRIKGADIIVIKGDITEFPRNLLLVKPIPI